VTFAEKTDYAKQKTFKLFYVQEGGVWKLLTADEVKPGK
jgi:hypothetical protein